MRSNTFKARGLVLSESFSGEADKGLILLCKEYGKIRISARGARKPGSKFFAAARLFAYGDYVIYKGKGFYSVAQCTPIYLFPEISKDYEKMCYGSYLLEFTQKATADELSCDDILYLLLKALKEIEKGAMNLKLIKAVFLLKFMALSGFEPVYEGCFNCGGSEGLAFGKYGFVCGSCKRGESVISISEDTERAIRFILECDLKKVFLFKASDKITSEVDKAAVFFMKNHMDICIKSEEFL